MTAPEELPRVWVGLGNPGNRYRGTRHNVGMAAVDFFLERFAGAPFEKTRHALVADLTFHGREVMILKPTTYMNLSGRAVRWALEKTGLGPESMIVFHDDLDLDLGRIKLKWKGGDAGHKGIRSIMETLRTDAFFRVRIGIGRPPEGWEASDYVLSRFDGEEEEVIAGTVARVAEGLEIWATKGTTSALNFLNRRD